MPIEVLTVTGESYRDHHDNDYPVELLAEDIEEAYKEIRDRNGQVLGAHVMKAGGRETLFIVADVHDGDQEELC